jgi:hypothetical protein
VASLLGRHWIILHSHWIILDFHWIILDSHWIILDCHWIILDSHWLILDCHWLILDYHWQNWIILSIYCVVSIIYVCPCLYFPLIRYVCTLDEADYPRVQNAKCSKRRRAKCEMLQVTPYKMRIAPSDAVQNAKCSK